MSITLYKVETAVDWIDPWGHRHSNLSIHVRVHEVVAVEQTEKFFMCYDGSNTWPVWIWRSITDDREWVAQDHPYGVRSQWDASFVPQVIQLAPVRQYESHGRQYQWLTCRQLRGRCPVNEHGKAVDVEGNLL